MDAENRLELFTDGHFIETLRGVKRVLQKPESAGIALAFDRPWEGKHSGYITVLKDDEVYRMYYRGQPEKTADYSNSVTCYAESRDGIAWEKPDLGLVEVLGTRSNNVLLTGDPVVTNNFSPFLDTRPGTPESERYKATAGRKSAGVVGLSSPDGIHWKKIADTPIIAPKPVYALDSQNLAFWSEHEGCYVFYARTFHNGLRSMVRAVSPDFVAWSDPVVMEYGSELKDHLYINQTHPYFRAPHIYVALPARFMPGRQALSDAEGEALGIDRYVTGKEQGTGRWRDISETVFMTSRGENRYDWDFKEAFVRPGLDKLNWVGRSNYAALGVVPTGPAEMSLYVQRHYPSPTPFLERLKLRTDGFVAVHASESEGELVTKPYRFDGPELLVNYATDAAGEIQVEVQDEQGKALPGFEMDACPPIIGDEIERAVSWRGGKPLSTVAGTKIRLRFRMLQADLFSVRL